MASTDGRNPNSQSNLYHQDLTKLDITKLSALSPEVISRQATINIGTIGHVAHGKSTVVKAISGVQTVRFKNELERNITIKLERLSESLIRMYLRRAEEKYENEFLEKYRRKEKRSLSPNIEDIPLSVPLPKKSKKYKIKQNVEDFVIEDIKNFKFSKGQQYFYVKWQGWSDSANTWEPIENLDNCPKVLSQFISEQEIKHHKAFEKIKEEISFGNLLSEENLLQHFSVVDEVTIFTLKHQLILNLLSMYTLGEIEEDHGSHLVEQTRKILQLYVLARKRSRQLIALKEWEDSINLIDKSAKLCIENKIDLAGPPENFQYINQSIPGTGVTIPDDPPIGCECEACNCRSKTCCGMQAGLFAYTVNKRLRVAPGTPIYECNKACKCPPECNNRVVQGGRNFRLCIFRTTNGCGWGVRTEQKIRQGQFICQYVGEVITIEEAEKRGREYDANGLTYLFDLDFNSVENLYTVDAAHVGNISHFINHSCDPNLAVWAVWADCLDPNLPMLALFATKDIEVGEQICFDYLQNSSDNESTPVVNGSVTENGIADDLSLNNEACMVTERPSHSSMTPISPSKSRLETLTETRNRTVCKCESLNCRKYLF